MGAGHHGTANLAGAVVGRSRDGKAIEQELAELEAIDEAGIPATGDLVVVRVVLLLQPLDPVVKLGRYALAVEREAKRVIGARGQRHRDRSDGCLARIRHVTLGEPPDVDVTQPTAGSTRAALDR